MCAEAKVKFSVITPVYNGEVTIGRTIESVINQSLPEWEMIIINNGSTDNTLLVVDKYLKKDSRIKLINCSEDSGTPAHPRNLGLREAKGTYISFLDADDAFYPVKLSEIDRFFNENPDIEVVCHGEDHIKNNKVIRKSYYGPYTTYKDLLFRENSLSTSAVIVRKEWIDKVGYFSESKEVWGFEDYDYWLRLAKVCKIGYIRKILGIYTVNVNSEAAKIAVNCDNAIKFLEKQFSGWEQKSLYCFLLMKKRKALCLKHSASEFIKMRHYKDAVTLLWRAVLYNPLDLKIWILLFFSLAAGVCNENEE